MLMSLYMGVSRICEAMGAGVWEGDNNWSCGHVGNHTLNKKYIVKN